MSREWHSGPPPHVGWWNASNGRNPEIWRWWNGHYWSCGAHCSKPAEQAAREADYKAPADQSTYEWTHRYPADARVPRIDPSKS